MIRHGDSGDVRLESDPVAGRPSALARGLGVHVVCCGLFLAGALSPLRAAAGPPLYEVRVDAARPLVAQVVLSAADGAPLRSAAPIDVRQIGVASQVSDVRCDGRALGKGGGGWRLPGEGCRRLQWQVRFEQIGPLGVDASLQQNVHDPRHGIWLLSEPASLLRVPATEAGAEIAFVGMRDVFGGASVLDSHRRVVPGLANAPEYYFFGAAAAKRSFQAGGRSVVYLEMADADYERFADVHGRGLDYLARVTQAAPSEDPSIVVWLPIDESRRTVGGAAGTSSITVNIVTVDGRSQPVRLPLSLHAILHEQFHQLAPQPLPAWVNESLAEYYARKAMKHAEAGVGAVHLIERRYPALAAAPPRTLLQVQRDVEGGDGSGYLLLYTFGSNFWLEIDRAIEARSAGLRSLDDELPGILRAQFTDARLPPALIARLRTAAGSDAFDALLARYVGQASE
jgi:hypothetical protein